MIKFVERINSNGTLAVGAAVLLLTVWNVEWNLNAVAAAGIGALVCALCFNIAFRRAK